MRSNEQIEGITINDFEIKLSAYADDTYFFALDIRSLLAVLDTCKTFLFIKTQPGKMPGVLD